MFVAEFWQVRQGKTFLEEGMSSLSFSKKTWRKDMASEGTCPSSEGRLCTEWLAGGRKPCPYKCLSLSMGAAISVAGAQHMHPHPHPVVG